MSVLRLELPAEVLDAIERCSRAYGFGLMTEEDWIDVEPNSVIGLAAFCYRVGVQKGRDDREYEIGRRE